MNDILNADLDFNDEPGFQQLVKSIQAHIDSGQLERYVDAAWQGRVRGEAWNGEYISQSERKLFALSGNHHTSTFGEKNYRGRWSIMRQERSTSNGFTSTSEYLVRFFEPPGIAQIGYQVAFETGDDYGLHIDWGQLGSSPSRLVKSTVEFGILSAFEDLMPATGTYRIQISTLRYHHLDTSFSLLAFVANRNLKRALFKEQEDLYPIILEGEIRRRFKPIRTIGLFNTQ